ncbi:hypothetical protein, partial [Burkholderia thailandensis]|uniref:hypothetical protein n=1 Tax=Burkholderia thailandensis TaxID=57975 RepID=UPI001CA4736D
MVWITGNLDGFAVLNRDTNCARIGTIMRTSCAGELCGGIHVLLRRFLSIGQFYARRIRKFSIRAGGEATAWTAGINFLRVKL